MSNNVEPSSSTRAIEKDPYLTCTVVGKRGRRRSTAVDTRSSRQKTAPKRFVGWITSLVRSLGFSQSLLVRLFTRNSYTQPMLIIEVWTNHETSLGWTRYTPRIYLSFVVMLLLKQCCILL
ncbi:hypothetical protein Hanom_Chr00s011161g01747271 [Helianthus anomalus]